MAPKGEKKRVFFGVVAEDDDDDRETGSRVIPTTTGEGEHATDGQTTAEEGDVTRPSNNLPLLPDINATDDPSNARDSLPSDSRLGSDSRFGSDSRYGSQLDSDSRAGSDDRTSGGVPKMKRANRGQNRALTRVAAGHMGDVVKETENDISTGFILKKKDNREAENYEKLFRSDDDPMRNWTPLYGGQVTDDGDQEYIRLENLTKSDYKDAYVLDIKLGVRTFVEAEAINESLRSDLFKKAMDLAPWLVTEEEKERGTLTKYRWMTIHDSQTTTIKEGWRIDGCAGKTETVGKKELQKNKTKENVMDFMAGRYMTLLVPEGGPARKTIAMGFRDKLKSMRDDFQQSDFFAKHEFIGTSLLLVADREGKFSANLIDFAKTSEVPGGIAIDHRKGWEVGRNCILVAVGIAIDPRKGWEVGNHEDGCLSGLDSLIDAWDQVATRLTLEDDENRNTVQGDNALGVKETEGVSPSRGQETQKEQQGLRQEPGGMSPNGNGGDGGEVDSTDRVEVKVGTGKSRGLCGCLSGGGGKKKGEIGEDVEGDIGGKEGGDGGDGEK